MSDQAFIFILKGLFKRYFENGESVGEEISKLVAKFRQEIEDDVLEFKYQEPKTKKNDHYNDETKIARKV